MPVTNGPPLDFPIRGQDETGAAFASVRRNFDRTAAAATRFERAGRGSFSRQFRGAAQQFGFQVSDVATQLQLGANAMQVFTIQGSQMLGFFGPFGALAGAALAIVGGLAGAFFNMGDAAEESGGHLEQLTDIMRKLRGVAEPTRAALEASARNIVGLVEDELDRARQNLALLQSQADQAGIGVLGAGGIETSAVARAREEVQRLTVQLRLAQAEAGTFGDRFSVSAKHAEQALRLARQQDEERARPAARDSARRDRRLGLVSEEELQLASIGIDRLTAKTNEWAYAGQQAAGFLSDAFVSLGERGSSAFDDIAQSARGLLRDMTRLLLNRAFTSLIGSAFGGGGGLFTPAGISIPAFQTTTTRPPGFASGGSFRVGGRSGTDANLVQFRATRGELVDVRKGGQQGGGEANVQINIHNAPEGTRTRESRSSGVRMVDVILPVVREGIASGEFNSAFQAQGIPAGATARR